MSKYLYGAAVQGIQDFIFKTNELKHIVGASELVEQICTSAFEEFEVNEKKEKTGESIVRAAGNIKFVFENLEDCKRAFRNFPKKIMLMAPGITVSQAVASYDDESKFGEAIDEVERLLKTQRNKAPKSVLTGLMGIKRANNTGLPVAQINGNGEFLDESTIQKEAFNEARILCKKSFNIPNLSHADVAYDISDIKGKNDWIAIIHADGNGLGKVVQKIGKKKEIFNVFSKTLDLATENAAKTAYEKVIKDADKKKGKIPARPVVLSGDDMTIIIRGDLAIAYASEFIKSFENETGKDRSKEETGKILGDILKDFNVFPKENGMEKNYLTACAGVAFIKSSYPFYYGYQLAEELCGQAKKDTKAIAKERGSEDNLPDSCLMFHKVQDSFITDYDAIVERELTIKYGGESTPLFKAGPYYLVSPKEGKNTVKLLEEYSLRLNGESGNGVKSGIRNWITLRLENKGKAIQRLERMKGLFSAKDAETISQLTDEASGTCMAYDVLAYNTVMNQQTNE